MATLAQVALMPQPKNMPQPKKRPKLSIPAAAGQTGGGSPAAAGQSSPFVAPAPEKMPKGAYVTRISNFRHRSKLPLKPSFS